MPTRVRDLVGGLRRSTVQHLRGQLDRVRVRRHRVLAEALDRLPDSAEKLRDQHERYVREVSSPDMAASLPTTALLLALCDVAQPRRILDLGSGFSTSVLGSTGAEVVSVDDSPEWLEATRRWLGDPPNVTLTTELDSNVGGFDLVFHDFSNMTRRVELLRQAEAARAPGGIVVLDDVHKWAYWQTVTMTFGRRFLSLRHWTRDRFDRFSGVVTEGTD